MFTDLVQVVYNNQIQTYAMNVDEKKLWYSKRKQHPDCKIYVWMVEDISRVEAKAIRFTNNKFRNRHFECRKQCLLRGSKLSIPKPSLYATSEFFLRMLRSRAYGMVQKAAQNLDGKTLKIGTACSGSDICVVAVQAMLEAINKEFQVGCLKDTKCLYNILFPYIYIYTLSTCEYVVRPTHSTHVDKRNVLSAHSANGHVNFLTLKPRWTSA